MEANIIIEAKDVLKFIINNIEIIPIMFKTEATNNKPWFITDTIVPINLVFKLIDELELFFKWNS